MDFLPAEIIKKKRNNLSLSEQEIEFFIMAYTRGDIPDYQMSALLMAIYFNSMTTQETLALTKTMLNSGIVIQHDQVATFKVDKHSTGGVGDKTSLILGPIVATLGFAVPMISGRGLGHTGGTLDKLESIPGFNTQLSHENFKKMVRDLGISFIGQTKDICPADKKIYALRDVTATIESLPLICASIMSKKLAEGIDGLVLDVKFGNGAFMKSLADAEGLANNLISIAKGYGKKVGALLTNMNEPLGRYAGNSLEVLECFEILQGKAYYNKAGRDLYAETRELSLQLSAYMLYLGGFKTSVEDCYLAAAQTLKDGSALQKFKQLVSAHGGQFESLPAPQNSLEIVANKSGYIGSFATEAIGVGCIGIRAGRAITADIIEPTAGVEFCYKIGDAVSAGDVVMRLYGADLNLLQKHHEHFARCIEIIDSPTTKTKIIEKVIL